MTKSDEIFLQDTLKVLNFANFAIFEIIREIKNPRKLRLLRYSASPSLQTIYVNMLLVSKPESNLE